MQPLFRRARAVSCKSRSPPSFPGARQAITRRGLIDAPTDGSRALHGSRCQKRPIGFPGRTHVRADGSMGKRRAHRDASSSARRSPAVGSTLSMVLKPTGHSTRAAFPMLFCWALARGRLAAGRCAALDRTRQYDGPEPVVKVRVRLRRRQDRRGRAGCDASTPVRDTRVVRGVAALSRAACPVDGCAPTERAAIDAEARRDRPRNAAGR